MVAFLSEKAAQAFEVSGESPRIPTVVPYEQVLAVPIEIVVWHGSCLRLGFNQIVQDDDG